MPERDLAAELAQPKYASRECERRWLVDADARPSLDGLECVAIEDRYLDGTRLRLRRMRTPDGAWTSCKLTKKYECPDPSSRPIVTAYLTEDEHARLCGLPATAIAKRRYRIPLGGNLWSLDLFEGALAGLEMVECETADEAALAALVPPPWATREVTDDARYQCGALAAAQAIPED